MKKSNPCRTCKTKTRIIRLTEPVGSQQRVRCQQCGSTWMITIKTKKR